MPTLTDVRAVDDALLAILTGDPILAALMPGGVHWDIGPPGLSQFVTISNADFVARLMFRDADGTETTDYLIKAISRSTSVDPVLDAAARIHDLLHRQPLNLGDSGYELMIMQRVRRVRFHEYDPQQTKWNHAGGVYRVMVTVGTPA
jgi:hypothetical protein